MTKVSRASFIHGLDSVLEISQIHQKIMYEITSENFEEYLPQMKESIRNCSFIAIDTEFTGLNSDPEFKSSLFDSAEDRYHKLRLNLNKWNFVICQFGFTLYFKDNLENQFTSECYSIYLCQRSFRSLNRIFSFQSGCLDFHRNNNFNFEKFLKHGVSYLNLDEEQLVLDELSSKSFSFNVEQELDEWYIQTLCSQVSTWVSQEPGEDELILNYSLPRDSGIQKYYLIKELRSRFPTIWAFSHPDEDSVIVRKVSKQERIEFENSVEGDDEKIFLILKGFSLVFQELVSSKKPLVGHNLFTDLIIIHHQFWKPLPKSYSSFKSSILSLFPVIYDTKHISSEAQRLNRRNNDLANCLSLLDLYKHFSQRATLYSPSIKLRNCDVDDIEFKPHDAGFDSFACGYIFIKLADFIVRSSPSENHHHPLTWLELLTVFEPYENKINLIRGATHHLNLSSRDSTSNRPPPLYVEMKTRALNILDLTKLLANYGNVDISPISEKKALVAIPNVGCAKDILREFKNNPDFKVSIYDPVKHSPFVRNAMLISCVGLISLSVYCIAKLL